MPRRRAFPFFFAVVCLLLSGFAAAQASRTWVSGVGSDANPCSRTAPCQTFAGAISKTATGGEIDALDPSGFGSVTITKSIIIDGSPGNVAGVLASGTNGIIVNAPAGSIVTLRNLSFNGLGETPNPGINGIEHIGAGILHVENCSIDGFGLWGINFSPNAANSRLFVRDTTLRNNGGGIFLDSPSNLAYATIENCAINNNRVTGQGNTGHEGVRITGGVHADVRNTSSSGNTIGFLATSSGLPPLLILENCSATGNVDSGLTAGGGTTSSIVFISNFVSTSNGTGLKFGTQGSIFSFGNNKICCNLTANGAPTSTIAPI